MSDSCPSCGKWTDEGLRKFALRARERPIYGTDFSKPLSEIVHQIRNDLTRARGQLSDVASAYTGWKDHVASIEGLLTCGIVSLHYVVEQMKEHEKR